MTTYEELKASQNETYRCKNYKHSTLVSSVGLAQVRVGKHVRAHKKLHKLVIHLLTKEKDKTKFEIVILCACSF